jgi:thiol-disulfide isomerase/thioredoxin
MSGELTLDRRRFLGTTMTAIAAARLGMFGSVAGQVGCAALGSTNEGSLPPFDGATTWLNTSPLSPTALRGRVVLVQFWTFTCINWLRTEPYIRAWARRYEGDGLTVIGVHSPEFDFEKEHGNVQRAVKAMDIAYPVAVDSNHAIWRAFNNAYWPALYLADAAGTVRYHHFGEGKYDESERMVQRLLAEADKTRVGDGLTPVDGRGIEADADWGNLRSAENYVGYDRTENFASPGGAAYAERRTYAIPAKLGVNQWALAGDWTMRGQPTSLNAAPGRVAYRFHARDLHLVMGPATSGAAVRFRVRIDGAAPGTAHGLDIDAAGNGTATEQRLYQLIRQPGQIQDRLCEIEFLDPGMEIFSFTFG